MRLANSATGHAMVKLSSHTSTHSELTPPILMAEIVPDMMNAIVIDEISADIQNCFLLINTLSYFMVIFTVISKDRLSILVSLMIKNSEF
ncbi:MAG: hypothetical protein ACI90A_001259 [Shewanella sp.]